MRGPIPGLVFLGLALFISSCASVSSYQTARTIPAGTFRIFAAAGYGVNPEQQVSQVGGATVREVRLPVFEGGIRLGIADAWDLGLKATLPGTGTLDFKHEIFRGDHWGLGVGFGGAYVAVTASNVSEESQLSAHVVDLIAPLYIDYEFDPLWAVYANPKYVHRLYVKSSVPSQGFAGGALGVKWGNRFGLYVEGAYLRDLTNRSNLLQGGVALFIGGGRSVPYRLPNERGRVVRYFPKSRTMTVRQVTGVRWKNGASVCIVRDGIERACGRIIESRGGELRVRLRYMDQIPRSGDWVIQE